MDFAQPVSFKNADIGRCAHQKPPEDEDGVVPAETIVQPEPGPTPAFPVPPTPVLAHVSDISYCFLVFFSFGHIRGMWKFLDQGSNPHHGSNLSPCTDDAGSLTHYATRDLCKFNFNVF